MFYTTVLQQENAKKDSVRIYLGLNLSPVKCFTGKGMKGMERIKYKDTPRDIHATIKKQERT